MQLIEQRIKFQLRIITKFLKDLLTAFSPYRAKLHRCKDIFSHWQCRQFRIIYYFIVKPNPEYQILFSVISIINMKAFTTSLQQQKHNQSTSLLQAIYLSFLHVCCQT